MANIISIGTAVPDYCHPQSDILAFMQDAYALDEAGKRKLAFLYRQSHIDKRYSVLPDFSVRATDHKLFCGKEAGNPSIGIRMELYDAEAPALAIKAIQNCLEGYADPVEITHLITVSCTGMSAPGIDLQIAETLELDASVFRTSVNFMGCYAAIHGLKLAKLIADSDPDAVIVVVAVELCTLHFQHIFNEDTAASSLLFGDGAAAVLISNRNTGKPVVSLQQFYSRIARNGKSDMAWVIRDSGFMMTLSGYIPTLIEADIEVLVSAALSKGKYNLNDIKHWCIHPGGRKILDVIEKKLGLLPEDTAPSRSVLAGYGNMSSPSVLFVLKEMMQEKPASPEPIFGVAFGPGLTMETFTAILQ